MENKVVYSITNKINHKRYVGSAFNFKRRINVHLSKLRNNKHHSVSLQRAFKKYTEKNFIFEILEENLSLNNIYIREQYFIDLYKSANKKYGYNMMPNVNSTKNRIVSKLTREKLRKANLNKNLKPETIAKLKLIHIGLHTGNKNSMFGKRGELSPNYKRKHTKQFGDQISKRQLGENNPYSKLTWDQVIEIRKQYPNKSMSELGRKYDVSRKCIAKIIHNLTWKTPLL